MSLVLAASTAPRPAAERERVVDELFDDDGLQQRGGQLLDRRQRRHVFERIAGYRVRNGRLVFAVPLRAGSDG